MNSLSLCTGYGGLELAVEDVFGVVPAYVSEVDPSACAVLAARFPGVPNIGDLTVVDWLSLGPVDVLTAGYPCQPFSTAGRRQGANDVRHLWPFIADAVGVLRPRLVVLENVAGHLSLGFDTVLADLARLGFDAEWCVVRASDVGACHRRARLFILAHPNDDEHDESACTDGSAVTRSVTRWSEFRSGRRDGSATHPNSGGLEVGSELDGQALPHPSDWHPRRRHVDGLGDAPAHSDDRADDGQRTRSELGQGSSAATDAEHDGWHGSTFGGGASQGEDEGWRAAADAAHVRRQRDEASRRRGTSASADRGPDAAHAHSEGSQGAQPAPRRDVPDWGAYGPAIERHAAVLGRPAPNPVDGRGRLNPVFVEWMMMLPAGWVTDIVTNRSKALKALGNGVVPPQAAYALRLLTERRLEAAA